MNKRLHLTLAALAATFTWAATASAAIIVNDTWLDGNRNEPTTATVGGPYSENGADGDLDGDIESVWYTSNAALMSSSAGHLMLAPSTTGSSSFTTYFTPEASPVTLAQGQAIRVTWEFTPSGLSASGNRDWRMALVNTGAAERITNNANSAPPNSAFTGYRVSMNVSALPSAGALLDLFERQVLTTENLLVNNDRWGANGTASATLATAAPTAGTPTMVNGTKYTFVLMIKRTLADAAEITATISGGNYAGTGSFSLSHTDPSFNAGSYTFDTFGMRPSNGTTTATGLDTTLFRVEVTPEPASGVLAAFGGLAALAFRRRR